MGLFRRKKPSYLIPVGPDNATNKDWVILLETSTIVGPSPDKLRVARSTLEKKIVKKYNILLRTCLQLSRMIAATNWTAARKFRASLS